MGEIWIELSGKLRVVNGSWERRGLDIDTLNQRSAGFDILGPSPGNTAARACRYPIMARDRARQAPTRAAIDYRIYLQYNRRPVSPDTIIIIDLGCSPNTAEHCRSLSIAHLEPI